MKIFCFSFFIAVMLVGCNPTRRIILKNNSGAQASLSWKLGGTDSLWRSPFFISSTDSSSIILQAQKPANVAEMSFGQGSWTPDVLQEAIRDLKSMHLQWNKGLINLNSREEIAAFLLDRRRGIDKHRIVIVLD
jgi:hypothetical protein